MGKSLIKEELHRRLAGFDTEQKEIDSLIAMLESFCPNLKTDEQAAKSFVDRIILGDWDSLEKEYGGGHDGNEDSSSVSFLGKIDTLAITNSKLENILFGVSEDGRSIDWSGTNRIEGGRVTVSKKNSKKDVGVNFDLDYSGATGFITRPLNKEEHLALCAVASEFYKFKQEHGYYPEKIRTTAKRLMRTMGGDQVRSEELEQILLRGIEQASVIRIKIDLSEHAKMKGTAVKRDVITDYFIPVRSREQEKYNGENVTYFEITMPPMLQYSIDIKNIYTVPAKMLQSPLVGNKRYTKERTFIAFALLRRINMPGMNKAVNLENLAEQSGQPYETKVQRQRFREKVNDILLDWASDPEETGVKDFEFRPEPGSRTIKSVFIDYTKPTKEN